MTDRRRGKTFRLSWKEWVDFCAEHGMDAQKERECGFDLGGGDCYTVACDEEPEEATK